jgi:predicted house-cleaning noncanonical NTP pyrophosphatase (MazG superfamily)
VAAFLDAAMIRFGKLVRDRIPEIIERAGKVPAYRTLDAGEFRRALREKLMEEAKEVAEASAEERLSEFADIAEVLDAALAAHGFSAADLQQRRAQRNAERGAFERRIYLESVDG